MPNLPIAVNLFRCEKILCFLYKSKKVPYNSFYEDEWFLDPSSFTQFTLFESNFVNITLDNYGHVEITNLKVLLFMVTFGTILIEYKIFDSEKEITKVTVSKLWLVYNKSSSNFYDKSSDVVLLATSNL